MISVDEEPAAAATQSTPAVSDSTAAAPEFPAASKDLVEKTIQQRSYRLNELLETEQSYVHDLEQCVEYIKYMKESKEKDGDPDIIAMPEDLKDGKDRMVFGNIEAIFEWHRE